MSEELTLVLQVILLLFFFGTLFLLLLFGLCWSLGLTDNAPVFGKMYRKHEVKKSPKTGFMDETEEEYDEYSTAK